MSTWVPVATFASEQEAADLRRLLHDAAIAAQLVRDAHRPLSKIELQVDQSQLDAAEAIINRYYGIGAESEEGDRLGAGSREDDGPRAPLPPSSCPNCGSDNIGREPRLSLFALLALVAIGVCVAVGQNEVAFFAVSIIAVAVLLVPPWYCRDCGQRWRGYNPQP